MLPEPETLHRPDCLIDVSGIPFWFRPSVTGVADGLRTGIVTQRLTSPYESLVQSANVAQTLLFGFPIKTCRKRGQFACAAKGFAELANC